MHEEKAKQLVDQFYNVNDPVKEKLGCSPFIDRDYAKQCALIAVDEILEALEDIPDLQVAGNVLLDKIQNLEKVKEAIIKL